MKYNLFTLKTNTTEENISLDFRLRKIDETRKFFTEEINQRDLMNKKHKKGFTALNYIERLHILVSTNSGWDSTSAFASLIGIPIGIASSAIGLKICAITVVIKRYRPIIKKREKTMIK